MSGRERETKREGKREREKKREKERREQAEECKSGRKTKKRKKNRVPSTPQYYRLNPVSGKNRITLFCCRAHPNATKT